MATAHTTHDGNAADDSRGPLIPRIRVTPQERRRFLLMLVAGIVLFWLFSVSMDALSPFIIALVLAYLMMPLVDRLARYMPRVLAIIAVYLVFLLAVGGFAVWLVPAIANQAEELAVQFPNYFKRGQELFANFSEWYNSLPIPDDTRQSIENSLRNGLGTIGQLILGGVVSTAAILSRTVGTIVGLLIIPFWLFYVLKDRDLGAVALEKLLPRNWHADVWRILRIINGILGSYIRGQLFLGLVVGVATTIGMLIAGAPYPLLLGLISGVTEIIPIIGPLLGAIPGVTLAAFSGEGWPLVLKVVLVYIVVQQLENNLLVPKIQGDSVKLHPTIIMVALVIGSQVAGFVGLIAAVPVAAIMRDVYLYLYRRFTEDYSPREAEASVPSREDESQPPGKVDSQVGSHVEAHMAAHAKVTHEHGGIVKDKGSGSSHGKS